MDDLIKILMILKDPALVVCMVVIFFLFRLLVKKDADLIEVHNTCSMNDREQTKTLAELVTLVKVLVNGRPL